MSTSFYRTFALNTLVSGAAGAIASLLAATICGRLEARRADKPVNAISHIAWGGPPPADPGRGRINTVTGLALHAGASLFWASFFEGLFGRAARRSAPSAVVGGAATSAAAYVTDYFVVPKRVRPGYEAFLSGGSLFAVYGALAVGLAIGARLTRLHDH